MMRSFYVLAFAAMALFGVAECDAVKAKTYWCDASKDKAGVGVPDTLAVNFTADRSNQQCRFSINGEPAGSPPRALLINAHNVLRDGNIVKRLENGEVEPLALALLASSPQRDIPEELVNALRNNAKDLATCFDSLEKGDALKAISKSELLCQVVWLKGETLQVKFGKGTFVVDETTPNDPPMLVLAVQLNALEHYLFIPAPYIYGKLPPLQ